MLSRIVRATTLALVAFGTQRPATAQTIASSSGTSVTFTMPVNLTQLSADLERVSLTCGVTSTDVLQYPSSIRPENIPRDEIAVIGGQVVTVMKVYFPIPAEWLTNAIGKPASYECALAGYSKSQQAWGFFSETSNIPALVLKPAPGRITGTFVW